MDAELKSLRIDREKKRSGEPSKWATRWIIGGVVLFVLLGGSRLLYERLNAATEVEVQRVKSLSSGHAEQGVVLNATGYIVAAHKIELAAKVIGKVRWIGVDKGDKVKQGQVLVRLEDDEYRAQLDQAKGNLANLEARLAELVHGSRPEEIAQALANLNSAKADMENARVSLERTRKLVAQSVMSQQNLDDAQARYDSAAAKANSLQKAYDLVRIGPRQEQIDAMRGQVEQARGAVAYAETNLANTIIRSPVTGTILERAVEIGEFVTTSFVGDRGAKGYVVSLADLNDLEVERASRRTIVSTKTSPTSATCSASRRRSSSSPTIRTRWLRSGGRDCRSPAPRRWSTPPPPSTSPISPPRPTPATFSFTPNNPRCATRCHRSRLCPSARTPWPTPSASSTPRPIFCR